MQETPIDDPNVMKLLISPVRYAIWIATIKCGPLTVQEIGEQIRRNPGALYRHIVKLEKAKLIRKHHIEQTGGRDAAAYSTPPNPYLVYDKQRPAVIDAMARIAETSARHAAAEFRTVLEAGSGTLRGEHRDTFCKSDIYWVDEKSLPEMNRKLDQFRARFLKSAKTAGKRPVRLTLLMRPGG